MRRLKTHFEQIPVEVVKKIIDAKVAEKKQTDGNDDVIVDPPLAKLSPLVCIRFAERELEKWKTALETPITPLKSRLLRTLWQAF
jgi:hypothetical protein